MTKAFSFAEHAPAFDRHIEDSIPSLRSLREDIVNLSTRFVQPDTNIFDLGCSSGAVLSAVREANHAEAPSASYFGFDVERNFEQHWRTQAAPNLSFKVGDVRQRHYKNCSFALSLFTMQFVPEGDRIDLMARIQEGLIKGGAFVVAEKVLADSARYQDMLAFDYYDYKGKHFSAQEILDKERGLRRQMHLWSEEEVVQSLTQAGFRREDIHRFWQRYLFIGWIAVKRGAPGRRVTHH